MRTPPYFDGMPEQPAPVTDISGARVLLKLGDSVTTDHISPAGNIKADTPAGKYLTEHGGARKDFNSDKRSAVDKKCRVSRQVAPSNSSSGASSKATARQFSAGLQAPSRAAVRIRQRAIVIRALWVLRCDGQAVQAGMPNRLTSAGATWSHNGRVAELFAAL